MGLKWLHLHLTFPNADLRTESKPRGDSRGNAGREEGEWGGERRGEKPIKGGHCRQQELNPAGLLREPVRKCISGGWCPYTPLPISHWLVRTALGWPGAESCHTWTERTLVARERAQAKRCSMSGQCALKGNAWGDKNQASSVCYRWATGLRLGQRGSKGQED